VTTTLLVVAVGAVLPFTPLAAALGFVPLPATYLLFLVGVVTTYLLLVEASKRRLVRWFLPELKAARGGSGSARRGLQKGREPH
jgi:hypothetical protein